MKVKCIAASKKGSITAGRFYEATPVPIVDNWSHCTTIYSKNIRFFLYNDQGQWKAYPAKLFVPA